MSTYPGQPKAPRKTLIWIAIASFVIGLGLAGFFAFQIVRTAPSSPDQIGSGGSVHLDEEGLTIYSSVPVPRPPCEVKDSTGSDVPMTSPKGSETITINDDTWYVIARSTAPVPAGDYVVSCGEDVNSASYAVGPRASVMGFIGAIFGLLGSLFIFFGLGAVLLIIHFIKRSRAKRPPTNNYPPQQGNYPPQPSYYPPPSTYHPGPNPDRPRDN